MHYTSACGYDLQGTFSGHLSRTCLQPPASSSSLQVPDALTNASLNQCDSIHHQEPWPKFHNWGPASWGSNSAASFKKGKKIMSSSPLLWGLSFWPHLRIALPRDSRDYSVRLFCQLGC